MHQITMSEQLYGRIAGVVGDIREIATKAQMEPLDDVQERLSQIVSHATAVTGLLHEAVITTA